MDINRNCVMLSKVKTAQEWSESNPVLRDREVVFTREGGCKIGDGTSKWSQLPYSCPYISRLESLERRIATLESSN